jgi:hypothetical protein
MSKPSINAAAIPDRIAKLRPRYRRSSVASLSRDVVPRAIFHPGYCRLHGTSGRYAVVGEALEFDGDLACWKLHPNYGEWFWPLLSGIAELVLLVPRGLLEPLTSEDFLCVPLPPSASARRSIRRMPERLTDCVRVYTLRLAGEASLVSRACPTRLANLLILREHRRRYDGAQPHGPH